MRGPATVAVEYYCCGCLELVGKQLGDLGVMWVDWAQRLGVVDLQPLEELLGEERVARLAGMEPIGGFCSRVSE